jgi:tRNA (guanine-N7-)-methyltransferase
MILPTPHRGIKSFVLRQGRLTLGQQRALQNHWSDYGIDYSESTLDFTRLFGRSAPLTLEIGFGDGDSLLQQALQNPLRDYLGIEVHKPGVGRLISRCHSSHCRNIRVINHDAIEVLKHQIPDQSLDCVQLFFPDPWHKKRHHKRRILQPEFVQLLHKKLSRHGRFHMATDWQPYAEHMLNVMTLQHHFRNVSGNTIYANNQDAKLRPRTKFEQRGLRLGHGVYDLMFENIG